MKLSMIPISMLFAYVVTTVFNYFEDTAGVNLIVWRCIAAAIAICILCMGLPSNTEYETEKGAY